MSRMSDTLGYDLQFDTNICIGKLCQRMLVNIVGGGIFGLTRGSQLRFDGLDLLIPVIEDSQLIVTDLDLTRQQGQHVGQESGN